MRAYDLTVAAGLGLEDPHEPARVAAMHGVDFLRKNGFNVPSYGGLTGCCTLCSEDYEEAVMLAEEIGRIKGSISDGLESFLVSSVQDGVTNILASNENNYQSEITEDLCEAHKASRLLIITGLMSRAGYSWNESLLEFFKR